MSLLASFMKLSKKREINQKRFQVTMLSQQYSRIQEQISVMEQAKSTMQNAWSTINSNIQLTAQNIFQASTANTYTEVNKLSEQLSKTTDSAKKQELQNQIAVAQQKATQEYNIANAAYQTSIQGLSFANQGVNSLFSAADDAQLKALNCQQSRIDLEKESLEGQLIKLNADYESYKKLEESEAKNAAPSFGL